MRKYGRSAERPQPLNIVGLPPADAIAAELAYARSFEPRQEATPTEQPIAIRQGDRTTYRRFGDTSIQALPQGRQYEGMRADRQAVDQAVAQKMQQQAITEAIAGGITPEAVFSEALGRPVSPSIATRAHQFAEILDLSPNQAVKLAEREAGNDKSARGKRALPSNWVEAIGQSGELGPDPAAKGALWAAIDGAIDVETPIEAQIRALDPYSRAVEAVAMAPQNRFRDVSPGERVDINSETGAGRKLRGGRRNSFDKDISERLTDPYLVPVLLAEASEPVWSKDPAGQWQQIGVQPPTITVGMTPEGRKQRVFDAGAVELGLLDPRATLPADMGYLRFTEPTKEVSGSYGAEVNAPTLQRLGEEIYGFAAKDDIAAAKESVPMTLGEATQDILYRNRTPISPYRDEDLMVGESGQLFQRQTGIPVYLLDDQDPNAAVKDYRVGSPDIYDKKAYQEFGRLIEGATGRPLRIVVNERLRDEGLNELQAAALRSSLPGEWLTGRKGQPLPPAYAVMTALARGAALPPAEVELAPLANVPSERAFYLEDTNGRGLGLQSKLNALKEAAIGQERASIGATPEVMARVPEAARGNLEAGLQSPKNSPRFKAAQDFLQRFMSRRF